MTLYLSPDQRFLTSTLYDLARDPVEEEQEVAANVRQLLMRDESPRISGPGAQITLVEFGDLQCPFCRRFADWYHSLPAELRNGTTLVFKHLPLANHSWARAAAVYGACAHRQSSAAFWELADYLLAHQGEVTPGNLAEKADTVLARLPNVNTRDVASCAADGTGSNIVARDLAVAKELGADRTPSLFIDGKRLPPFHSAQELQQLLERELRDRLEHATSAAK